VAKTFGAVVLTCATVGALANAADEDPVPWPRGQPPSPTDLDDKLSDAVELFELDREEEFLEAFEFGEESEHIFVLQRQIDAGYYTPEGLFRRGDSIFEHEFRDRDGYGDANNVRLIRVHDGARGGLDGYQCGGCHAVGGLNGSGTATANAFYFGDGERTSSAVIRNPPHVLGLGYVQELAHEMSVDLARRRDTALKGAKASGKPVHAPLLSKGVSFGSLVAHPDGTVDYGGLEGVDEDLIVKPFGWKGHTAELRRFAERAALIHFGIQSHVLTVQHRDDPDPGLLGFGHKWWDPDADNRQRELEEGALTALAVYMALLEVPVIIPPHDAELRRRWANGSRLFDSLGCVDCHRRALTVTVTEVFEEPDTTGGPAFRFRLGKDGEKPRIDHAGVPLFSDLKRHDMGPELADDNDDPDGVGRRIWLTRPLWGLAETPPYLHDGRAGTIPEAIRAHGGEASSQQAAFVALTPREQADVHIFLLSLTREPKLRVDR
jgi:hypothetical protein